MATITTNNGKGIWDISTISRSPSSSRYHIFENDKLWFSDYWIEEWNKENAEKKDHLSELDELFEI